MLSYLLSVLRFDNLDERTVMTSAGVIGDDKRNLYSPEIFLYDIAFDPDKHNLNSPSVIRDEKVKNFKKGEMNLIRYRNFIKFLENLHL